MLGDVPMPKRGDANVAPRRIAMKDPPAHL